MAHMLRHNGQQAVVVIASDGEASDGNVADQLKPLQVIYKQLCVLIYGMGTSYEAEVLHKSATLECMY